jgi:hypothetical protein
MTTLREKKDALWARGQQEEKNHHMECFFMYGVAKVIAERGGEVTLALAVKQFEEKKAIYEATHAEWAKLLEIKE